MMFSVIIISALFNSSETSLETKYDVKIISHSQNKFNTPKVRMKWRDLLNMHLGKTK